VVQTHCEIIIITIIIIIIIIIIIKVGLASWNCQKSTMRCGVGRGLHHLSLLIFNKTKETNQQ